jgi:signal transduction histidine kinase
LVAWNIGVLCAVLLIVAAAMYISQSQALATEVDGQLASQAHHELVGGRLLEDLAEPPPGAATSANAIAEEDGEPYEASESPNIFALLLDPHGHVMRSTHDVQAPGVPDMATVWPVLRGTTPRTLVTLDVHSRSGDEHFRLYTVPVQQGGRVVGALQVGTSLAPRYAELRHFLLLLAIIGGIGVLLVAAGGVFLAERALVPAITAFERQRSFVADASHELRTPLSLMRAEAETLLRSLGTGAPSSEEAGTVHRHLTTATPTPGWAARGATHASVSEPEHAVATSAVEARPPEEYPELAEMAELSRDLVAEVDYMSHLVNDLLQLARLDRSVEPLRHELVALDTLTERTCRFAEPLAAERGLRLSFSAAPLSSIALPSADGRADGAERVRDAPTPVGDDASTHRDGHSYERAPDAPSASDAALQVWGDPDRLRQILLILLDNALRYTPAGGAVRVACWQEPRGNARGGHVMVRVADTGPGIAPEHLPRLFDRFYRVDKARSRELGGSGLGLAIADELARAHGGALNVESTLGAGTSFCLTLPAAPQD